MRAGEVTAAVTAEVEVTAAMPSAEVHVAAAVTSTMATAVTTTMPTAASCQGNSAR